MTMKIGKNLSIYMDGMPLEGNVVLSCVQQDGLGHVSCLPLDEDEDQQCYFLFG